MARKTWVSVVIAVGIIAVMFCVALIGGGAYFVRSHIHAQFVPPASAADQLGAARARFAGQRPMIEIASDEIVDTAAGVRTNLHAVVNREPTGAPGPIKALHVLAFDGRAGKLVQADIPRWMLSLGSMGGRIRIANLDLDDPDLQKITLDDLDRRGPGLIIDVRQPQKNAQVLVWTD